MTPLILFLSFVSLEDAARAGERFVWAILIGTALFLYWKSVKWCADALYISDMRAQERVSQKTLLEVADYLENLSNRKHEQLSEWDDERAFGLDHNNRVEDFPRDPENDDLLFHQLKKSLEQTKRGPDDNAA